MTIKYRELKRRYDLDGPQKTTQHLTEALKQKQLRPEDFSLRDLAEALVPDGHEWVRTLDPRSGGVNLLEVGDGVDVTAFLNISSQLIYSKIMEGYTNEAFVVSRLVDTVPTRFDGEKFRAFRTWEQPMPRCILACPTPTSALARITSRLRRPPSAVISCQ
jgi:hypothetical protein